MRDLVERNLAGWLVLEMSERLSRLAVWETDQSPEFFLDQVELTDDHRAWKSLYFAKRQIMPMWRYEIVNLLRQTYQRGELALPEYLHKRCPDAQAFNAEAFIASSVRRVLGLSTSQLQTYHQPLALMKLIRAD